MISISVLFLVFVLLVLLVFLFLLCSGLLLQLDLFCILTLVNYGKVWILFPALTAEEFLDVLRLSLQLFCFPLVCADAVGVEPFLAVVTTATIRFELLFADFSHRD